MAIGIEDVRYGGSLHKYLWTKENPNANVENCMPNCTTCAYGLSLADGDVPVSKIANGGNWHLNLINGWTSEPYNKSKVNLGDIIEWNGHVAKVTDITNDIYITGSFYTGEHGKSKYNNKWDTRTFDTLEEVSKYMERYAYRFIHHCTIETETQWVGSQPTFILHKPQIVVKPVKPDTSKEQIEVLTDTQYLRSNPNGNVIGSCPHGYYNVLDKVNDNYVWYKIAENVWIAQVNGRVVHHDKSVSNVADNTMEQINKLAKEIIELTK